MDGEELFGRHVLIAEDEYLVAFDLADFLERAGATIVGPVSNVDDAIGLVERSDGLDLAVIDVNLQGGQSFRLADVLRSHGKSFVFVTGQDRAELARKYPGVPVVEKPFDYATLLTALGELAAAPD